MRKSYILGSRRKILFVEGKKSSLDLQLYQILFPDISIKPIGSCAELEKIVKGLNASEKEHWISAIGIVDRDNRQDMDCSELIKHGIIPINQYSVESIYYHPLVIRDVLNRVANIYDLDVDKVIAELNQSIISALMPHVDRMAARMVERTIQDKILRQTPNWKSILKENCHISFSTQSLLDKEKEYLNSLIASKNIEDLISRYPVRETPVLECVATALYFQNQEKYEHAVRKMLIDSKEERKKVLGIIQPVTDYINSLNGQNNKI